MAILPLVFYILAIVTITSAVMVVTSRNPVYAVLFLILTFFNAAGLFLLMNAEFLAMILLIIYIGAVAVLFLFVVMMLNINLVVLRQGFTSYLPIGGMIVLALLAEIIMVIGLGGTELKVTAAATSPISYQITNAEAIGRVIYTDYVLAFHTAGIVLLVSMIGAIVLALRQRTDVKRQSINKQNIRLPEEVVELVKVTRGRGV
ncbi:NADH-ubiquinone/plastoquinone oxidoreductase chain 6 family protein [Candidatus Endolissoclinum faulkneri L2]|uniref:NADH-quinone oxidoreductase subunit J n=1 Tax=Candidatus Endolissoclinum faulkneri L2 TaxID=1193729 RepID=K7YGT5_9PROT|nr:NADH-quinone oxidoreductase subunit J [Candidatus Endolissoclinum faulkneri]AFX98785.1 NADH-ubiquinone/plastoquinone oxidoreductase chain 6 family protein [Candidatus Endolissoclinum faulkneri L2]